MCKYGDGSERLERSGPRSCTYFSFSAVSCFSPLVSSIWLSSVAILAFRLACRRKVSIPARWVYDMIIAITHNALGLNGVGL